MQTCPACNSQNPLYTSHCLKCATVIRDRVPNIDFWASFWEILHNPKLVLSRVVQAEKKNFIFFLLILICLKVAINTQYFFVHVFSHEHMHYSGIGLLWSQLIIIWLIVPTLLFLVFRKSQIKFRWKDLLAITIYSHVPMIMVLVIIFMPQFILWGPYLFTNSPSPFLIYSTLAWFFSGIELLAAIWCFYLLLQGVQLIIPNKKTVLVFASIYYLLLHGISILYIKNF